MVFVVSITGTLYVFEEELFKVFHAELFHLKPAGRLLNLSQLRNVAAQAIPGKKITSIEIPGDASEPYVFIAQKVVPKEEMGLTYFSQLDYWNEVFVDPYLERYDYQNKSLAMKWRNSNLNLHTGRLYGWPTQILFLLLNLISASLPITGFLIWWGKRKKKFGSSGSPGVTQSSESSITYFVKVS